MRFLLSALGSAGDVHPFIAIGQALVARGHEATVLTAPTFEARIRRAGLLFAPFGAPGDYERLLERPELWQPRGGARFILDEVLGRLPEAYATTHALATPGTVLVGSTLSWGMRLAQETTGLPGATVHLSPLCIPSAIDPPAWPGVGDLRWLPIGLRRAVQRTVDRQVIDRLVTPRLDACRATLGLAPVTHVWSRWMHAPDLVVGAWPAWFAPWRADWPQHARTTGFPLFVEGDAGSVDEALEAFLARGAPPVGITPGSAMAHGRTFIERALAACAATGRRALVVTPFADQVPLLPASAYRVPYAPFSTLLGRLSALVHHGGVGTAAQALAAGLPQVVAPFAHDQLDNAARLRRLGVARVVAPDARVGRWNTALDGALDVGTRRAANEARMRMASELPAAAMIADALEALGRGAAVVTPSAASPSA